MAGQPQAALGPLAVGELVGHAQVRERGLAPGAHLVAGEVVAHQPQRVVGLVAGAVVGGQRLHDLHAARAVVEPARVLLAEEHGLADGEEAVLDDVHVLGPGRVLEDPAVVVEGGAQLLARPSASAARKAASARSSKVSSVLLRMVSPRPATCLCSPCSWNSRRRAMAVVGRPAARRRRRRRGRRTRRRARAGSARQSARGSAAARGRRSSTWSQVR